MPPPLGLVFVLVGLAGRSIGSLVSKSNHSIHWSVAVSALVIPPLGLVFVWVGVAGSVGRSIGRRVSIQHGIHWSVAVSALVIPPFGLSCVWVGMARSVGQGIGRQVSIQHGIGPSRCQLGLGVAVCWSWHRTSGQHSTPHWSIAVSDASVSESNHGSQQPLWRSRLP